MIAIGCDHGGYILKEQIKQYLSDKNIEYKDFGTYSQESIDYPDVAKPVCEAVVNGECKDGGILICGTGIGMSIAANKIKGIRAALCSNGYTAKMTKQHNNANVICMGARVIGNEIAFDIIDQWLNNDFMGGRHQNRLDKIDALENK